MDSPVVRSAEMRAMEEAAFARGVSAEALMDEAGAGIANVVSRFFPAPGHCVVFAGKGNNAGDAFVAAAHLQRRGWKIETRLAFPESELGELPCKKLRGDKLPLAQGRAEARPSVIILDGLLGLGAKLPLREPMRTACRELNQLRERRNAFVFALDLPTGLDGDSGEADGDCVVADFTITIGFAKCGLIADDALNFVGRLEVVALPDLRSEAQAETIIASATSLRDLLPRRNFGAYKNQFGRVGIVAGSKGFTGATIMCSLGALRAGAGLVEVFVPKNIYEIVAAAAPPEAMVKPIVSYERLLDEKADVWAIGPGLGRAHSSEILELVRRRTEPMVVDADALNILSKKPETLNDCAGPRLLTPHPGEMQRLFPESENAPRPQIVRRFCEKYPATLLLKGSRTIVGERARSLSYNPTGNPGMATGGMGDILTGVCAAFLGQKLSPYDAARLGAWICGRAAEIAIFRGNASEQSLLPCDVLDHLGLAFRDLQNEAE